MQKLLLLPALTFLALPAAAANLEAMCQYLPVKGQFGGAEYVPGVDVHGNPVVPADLEAPPPDIDVIRFPVTIDLAQQIDLDLPQGTEMQAPFAMVEIYPDGSVTYNGKNYGPEIYRLCGKEPLNYKAEPAASAPPVPVVKPEKIRPEDIIWGEGY